jgi:protein FAM50
VAGSRAANLTKKRLAAQNEFETKKQKIRDDSTRQRQSINHKFDTNSGLSLADKLFREKTVGLVSAQDFKAAQEESALLAKKRQEGLILEENGDGDGHGHGDGSGNGDGLSPEERAKIEKQKRKERKKLKKKKKKMLNTLSFASAEDADGIVDDIVDDLAEDEKDDNSASRSRSPSTRSSSERISKELKKNPFVDTSFLPDKEREEQVKKERLRLKNEWITKQIDIKKEILEITYSYWDGSGHRRTVNCKKGDTIAEFLEQVRKALAKEFREMQNVSADALIYVKEDLIIPQDISFYDLIVTKARGKSGPLFNFDVHDDVRFGAIDARVEKDESHPGKVVERAWYERNKHIFPASRWEVFDPAKEYGKYTIHGGEVTTKKK